MELLSSHVTSVESEKKSNQIDLLKG
jgi:hypothetical protein